MSRLRISPSRSGPFSIASRQGHHDVGVARPAPKQSYARAVDQLQCQIILRIQHAQHLGEKLWIEPDIDRLTVVVDGQLDFGAASSASLRLEGQLLLREAE